MQKIIVRATKAAKPSNTHPLDRDVDGDHEVYVPANLSGSKLESAALDEFHATVPVKRLECFEFEVIKGPE